ncbi:hypothetical protein INR49_009547 [Caranx melampygus]|nr:hypothetical protein INR49_009547 [Caranx melampygus]
MCPHTCVTNLPKPRQKQPVGVGPASVMVGNLVAGKRIAQAAGRDLGMIEDQDLVRKGVPVSTASCVQLHKRAEKIAAALTEKGSINTGENVVLLHRFDRGLLRLSLRGCVPVNVRPPHPQNLAATLPTVRMIIDVVSKAACILTTQNLMRTLRSKEAAASVNIKTWPTIIDTDDLPRRRPPQIYKPPQRR